MQLIYPPDTLFFVRRHSLRLAAGLVTLFAGAGCADRPTTIDPPPERPHAGAVLTVAAADPADRELLRQLGRAWSARSGADVRILDGPWDGTADVGLIPTADMPRWAEAGRLAEVPAAVKQPAHPYRWDDLFPVYPVRLTTWRDKTYALPVLGEGMVLVYRKDAVGLGAPPATWADLAARAEALGKNSLPPLPADPERLGAEFFTAAACYDRPAIGRIASELLPKDFFAFQFDPNTGDPRLDKPAFRHVAELFRQMGNYRSAAPDAVAAFNVGEAKLGVLSLAELGRLSPDVRDAVGIAPLPGAEFTFDADGRPRPTEQQTVNRVPYQGWGGRVGVVSAACAAPAAAWDFLTDAGLPERTALDLLAEPRWGAGPYRSSQLDIRARPRWFGYGLPAAETDRLMAALRDSQGQGVQNYRVRLRTPNQADLAAAFHAELRKVLASDQPADLTAANDRWKQIIGQLPGDTWREQARKSLGLSGTP